MCKRDWETHFSISSLAGKLNDYYGDYKYTYQACGIILVIASIFLFVGMGINYHLVDKEKREEERRAKQEEKDAETNVDNALMEKAKEVDGDAWDAWADIAKWRKQYVHKHQQSVSSGFDRPKW